MKVLKTLVALSVLSLAAGNALAQDPQPPKPAGKPAACCAKNAAEGKACGHSCCVEAAKAGQNCEKCGGKNEKKS